MDGLELDSGSNAEVRASKGWAPDSVDLPNAWLNLVKEEMDTNKGECLAILADFVWIKSHSHRSSLMFCDLSPNPLCPSTPFFQFLVPLQGAMLLNLYLPVLRLLDQSLEPGKAIHISMESGMTVWGP